MISNIPFVFQSATLLSSCFQQGHVQTVHSLAESKKTPCCKLKYSGLCILKDYWYIMIAHKVLTTNSWQIQRTCYYHVIFFLSEIKDA